MEIIKRLHTLSFNHSPHAQHNLFFLNANACEHVTCHLKCACIINVTLCRCNSSSDKVGRELRVILLGMEHPRWYIQRQVISDQTPNGLGDSNLHLKHFRMQNIFIYELNRRPKAISTPFFKRPTTSTPHSQVRAPCSGRRGSPD